MKNFYLLLTFLLITYSNSFAQINEGGKPFKKYIGLKSSIVTKIIKINEPNLDSLLSLIPENDRLSDVCAVALDVKENLLDGDSYKIDGGTVYELTIEAEKAQSLIIEFSEFHLPQGAKVYVFNKNQTLGAYTEKNNKKFGKLTLQFLEGSSATIQLMVPDYQTEKVKLSVGSVGYGFYKSGFRADYDEGGRFGQSLSCNNDINSLAGVFVQKEKNSVVRIIQKSDQFFVYYSGVLINNYKNNGEPYFLTARHCFENVYYKDFHEEYAQSAVAYFDYESPEGGVNGDWSKTISGAEIICADTEDKDNSTFLDLVLLKFNETPPASYEPVYAGVNANHLNLDNPDERYQSLTIIHHPRGDVKKVTLSSRIKEISNNNNTILIYKDNGVTEVGSSGSPLFDNQYLVIGNLSFGGTDECDDLPDTNFDGFESLAAAYDYFPILRDLIFGATEKKIILEYKPNKEFNQLMFQPNLVKINIDAQTFDCKNISSSNFSNFRWDFGPHCSERYFTGKDPIPVTFNEIGYQSISLTAYDDITKKDQTITIEGLIYCRYEPAKPGFIITNCDGKEVKNSQFTDTLYLHNVSSGYADNYVFSIGGIYPYQIETTKKDTILKLPPFSKEELSTEESSGKNITITMTQVNPDQTKIFNRDIRIFPETKAYFTLEWENTTGSDIPENYFVANKTIINAIEESEGYNLVREWYVNNELKDRYNNKVDFSYLPDSPGTNELKLVVYNEFSRDSLMFSIDVHLTTGVNSNSLDGKQLKVYPTLFKDQVTIDVGTQEIIMMSLIDCRGQILQTQIISARTILNVSKVPSGIYFLVLIDSQKNHHTTKIIKY